MAWLKLPSEMLQMQFYCTHVESYIKSEVCEYSWQSGSPRAMFQPVKVGRCFLQLNTIFLRIMKKGLSLHMKNIGFSSASCGSSHFLLP